MRAGGPQLDTPKISHKKSGGTSDDKVRDKLKDKTLSQIENDGREQYFHLRNGWSRFLMIALPVSMLFQAVVVLLVGAGKLPFEHQQVFLNMVSGEIFLQIAAMCLIVVRCLFPSKEPRSKKKKSEPGRREEMDAPKRGGTKEVKPSDESDRQENKDDAEEDSNDDDYEKDEK